MTKRSEFEHRFSHLLPGTPWEVSSSENANNDLAEGITSICIQGPACLLHSITASNYYAGQISKVTDQSKNKSAPGLSFHLFKVGESKHDLNGNTNVLIHFQLQM